MRITIEQAQAWGETSKMSVALASLDTALLNQLESVILGRISSFGIDVTLWADENTTPELVRTIIAMKYVSWLIDRQYSTDAELSSYAARLDANAELLMVGLSDGSIELPGYLTGTPSFYPNDNSSASRPTVYDRSLGPAAFSMNQVF